MLREHAGSCIFVKNSNRFWVDGGHSLCITHIASFKTQTRPLGKPRPIRTSSR